MNTEEAVVVGAASFEKAESYAKEIKADFRDMRTVFEAIRDEFHIGGLEAQALAGRVDALITQFEADLYVEHSYLTELAKAKGIDLPQPKSGGR